MIGLDETCDRNKFHDTRGWCVLGLDKAVGGEDEREEKGRKERDISCAGDRGGLAGRPPLIVVVGVTLPIAAL